MLQMNVLYDKLVYLLTYKNHKKIFVPRTENPLEPEVFSPMQKLINAHAGMSLMLALSLGKF